MRMLLGQGARFKLADDVEVQELSECWPMSWGFGGPEAFPSEGSSLLAMCLLWAHVWPFVLFKALRRTAVRPTPRRTQTRLRLGL